MRWIILVACLSLASTTWAGDFRCAVVDMTKLFNEYPPTAKAKEKLGKWEKKKNDDLADIYQELSDLDKEIKDPKLSPKLKGKKQDEFNQKFADYKEKQFKTDSEIREKESDMSQAIVEDIKPIVAAVAKDKGIDLVLDSGKVVYSSSQQDLTKDVLERFKKLKDDADSKK